MGNEARVVTAEHLGGALARVAGNIHRQYKGDWDDFGDFGRAPSLAALREQVWAVGR